MGPKSDIWKYFVKQDKKEAKCKVCGKSIKTSGNTSNLRGHFKMHTGDASIGETNIKDNISLMKKKTQTHLNNDLSFKSVSSTSLTPSAEFVDVESSIETLSVASVSPVASTSSAPSSPPPQKSLKKYLDQTTISSSFSNLKSFSDGGKKHSRITSAIVKFTCRDNLPFSAVEGKGFKNLMKEVTPLFKVPTRNTIKSKILDLYDVLMEKFKEELVNAVDITITADIWTETMSMKSFLGVTIHFLKGLNLLSVCLETLELCESHTAQYVADSLLSIFKKWGIDQNKIVAVVTDNDAKMIKAVQIIFGLNRHINCFAHTINLTVENGIKTANIDGLISKVREIVLFFKRSTLASDDLRKKQQQKGLKGGDVKKLKLDVKTRWNSTYYMVERFLKLLPTVNDILLTKPTSPPMLSAMEIESLKAATKILIIFEKVTVEASGQNYVTLSKIIPMANCLKENLNKLNPKNGEGKRLQEALTKEISKRFGTIENAHLLSLSTILDPRFKTIHHLDPLAIAKTITYIKKLIEENVNDHAQNSGKELRTSTPPSPFHEEVEQELDIWCHHKKLVEDTNIKTKDTKREFSELSLYLGNPVVDLNVNPLQVWEEWKHVYPNLYPIARKYISPVGTSVPSERQFSKASATITPARNRLLGDSLSKLIFLGSLPDEYWV